MPAARESLLDAAYTALTERAWTAVRMVDVAAAAGVSRQTLYNEFGSKEGLARALVRRETDNYLAGVARALSQAPPAAGARQDAAGRVAAAAAWTLRTARANPLVRAVLTGCWSDRLPAPAAAGALPPGAARPGIPAQRTEPSADGPLPGPAELVGRFCDQAVAALEPDWPEEALPALGTACETAARLTLACVVAPVTPGAAPSAGRVPARRSRRELEAEAVSRLVRGAFADAGRRAAGGAVLTGRQRRADEGRVGGGRAVRARPADAARARTGTADDTRAGRVPGRRTTGGPPAQWADPDS